MYSSKIFALFIVLVALSTANLSQKCCSSYDKSDTLCLSCPLGSQFQANNCVSDTDYCLEYSQCFLCSKCAEGYAVVDDEVLGLKIKRCQEVNNFKTLKLEDKNQGTPYDAYLIADDFLKSIRKEVKTNGIIKSISYKVSGDEVYTIQLDYQLTQAAQQSKFVRAIMRIDLGKYDFKQITFSEITKEEIGNYKPVQQIKNKEKIQISDVVGADVTFDQYVEKTLDLTASPNFKLIPIVDKIARGNLLIFKKLITIKVLNYNNKTKLIQMTYLTQNQKNHTIRIDAQTRKVVAINDKDINNVPFLIPKEQVKPIISQSPVIISNPPLTSLSAPKLQLKVEDSPTILQLAKQQVKKQASTPALSDPIPLKTSAAPLTSISQTVATPPASTSNATIVTPQKSIPSILDPKTGIWTRQSIVGYTLENSIEALKDLKFLVAKDIVNKKLAGYQDILPAYCYSKEQGSNKWFLMIYNKPDLTQTEIIVKVTMPDYIPELIQEHKIGVFSTSDSSKRSYIQKDLAEAKSSLYIPAAIQISKVSKSYSSDNLISISVNDDDPNTIYFKSVYNVSGKLMEIQSLTKKKLRIGQFVSEKDISPPQQKKIIAPKEAQTEIKPNTTIGTTVQSANSTSPVANPVPVTPPVPSTPSVPTTPSVPATPPVPATPSPINTTPASQQKTVDCQVAKILPKIEELLKFSANTEVSPLILNQITGFSPLTESTAAKDPNFLKTEAYIECINQKVLKNSQILAVYAKMSGFSNQYKIYHETGSKVVYETHVSYDRLRNKIYLINFSIIAYGMK